MVEHYCSPKWKPGTSRKCKVKEHPVKLQRTKRPTINDGRK